MSVTLLEWCIPLSILLCGLGLLAGKYQGFSTSLWGYSLLSLGTGYGMMLFQTNTLIPLKQIIEDGFILGGVILACRALINRKAIEPYLPMEIALLLAQSAMVLASLVLFRSVKLETLFVQICCTIVLWWGVLRYAMAIQTKADRLLGGTFLFFALVMSLECILYLAAPDAGGLIGSWRSSISGSLIQYTGLLGSIILTFTVMLATSSDFIEKYR